MYVSPLLRSMNNIIDWLQTLPRSAWPQCPHKQTGEGVAPPCNLPPPLLVLAPLPLYPSRVVYNICDDESTRIVCTRYIWRNRTGAFSP